MSLSIAYSSHCADIRSYVIGKKERYSGVEHGVEDLVEKSKVDIVVQRQAPLCMALSGPVRSAWWQLSTQLACSHAAGPQSYPVFTSQNLRRYSKSGLSDENDCITSPIANCEPDLQEQSAVACSVQQVRSQHHCSAKHLGSLLWLCLILTVEHQKAV